MSVWVEGLTRVVPCRRDSVLAEIGRGGELRRKGYRIAFISDGVDDLACGWLGVNSGAKARVAQNHLD